MIKRMLITLAFLISPVVSQASLIDFTDISWRNAINAGDGYHATIGNVSLTSSGGYLSFNGGYSERSGCASGQSTSGLTCNGDGIGINNDEITQGGNQMLEISFAKPVDVTDILLLDLFGSESTGEIAVIDGTQYGAPFGNLGVSGGFFATGFSADGITSILLSGNLDRFSDYALAAVEVSPVPIPGAVFLFGSALLGFMGFKRFNKQ